MPNERGTLRKRLKYTPLSVYVRDAFRISTWSLSSGLFFQVHNSRRSLAFTVLLLVVVKQRYINASAPFLIGGELPEFVVRPHAPNREACTVTIRYLLSDNSIPTIYSILFYSTVLSIYSDLLTACNLLYNTHTFMKTCFLCPLDNPSMSSFPTEPLNKHMIQCCLYVCVFLLQATL